MAEEESEISSDSIDISSDLSDFSDDDNLTEPEEVDKTQKFGVLPYQFEPEYDEAEAVPEANIVQVDGLGDNDSRRLVDLKFWCTFGHCQLMDTEKECSVAIGEEVDVDGDEDGDVYGDGVGDIVVDGDVGNVADAAVVADDADGARINFYERIAEMVEYISIIMNEDVGTQADIEDFIDFAIRLVRYAPTAIHYQGLMAHYIIIDVPCIQRIIDAAVLEGITVLLQKEARDIVSAVSMIEEVKLEYIGTEPKARRTAKKQTHHENANSNGPLQYYQRNTGIPFIDHIIVELDVKFSDISTKASKLCVLVPSVFLSKDASVSFDDLKASAVLYKNDLPSPEVLEDEFLGWQLKFNNVPSEHIPNNCADALKHCNEVQFPNIFLVLKIACVIPVTSCICERSISVMRRLNNYMRCSMGQDRLNSLALMHIHYDKEILIDDVIDMFCRKQPRRLQFQIWEEARLMIADTLNIRNDDILSDALEPLKRKFLQRMKEKRNKFSADRDDNQNITVLDSDNFHDDIECDKPQPARKKYKHFSDLSRKQLLRRTDEIYESVCNMAESENLEPSRLLGFLLTRCETKGSIHDIGIQIWQNTYIHKPKSLPFTTALAIYSDCSLGRLTYTKQKKILIAAGHQIFLPWSHLRKEQTDITPEHLIF
ncbi:repressor of the inhibitor of the protein kinase [Nymphon striatum]|nr:repressor of the inhibitor of the protein kinase [Nymphon striatum]